MILFSNDMYKGGILFFIFLAPVAGCHGAVQELTADRFKVELTVGQKISEISSHLDRPLSGDEETRPSWLTINRPHALTLKFNDIEISARPGGYNSTTHIMNGFFDEEGFADDTRIADISTDTGVDFYNISEAIDKIKTECEMVAQSFGVEYDFVSPISEKDMLVLDDLQHFCGLSDGKLVFEISVQRLTGAINREKPSSRTDKHFRVYYYLAQKIVSSSKLR